MVALLLMVEGAWAQTVEPSQTLTEITKMGSCTVYSFNYPSVSATGKPTVLSSALFAWTPSDRQETDSIETPMRYYLEDDGTSFGLGASAPHPVLPLEA